MCWTNHEEIRGLYVDDIVQKANTLEPVTMSLSALAIYRLITLIAQQLWFINVTNGKQPEPKGYDLSSLVTYSDLEQMLTPEFLLHERPCELTKQTDV